MRVLSSVSRERRNGGCRMCVTTRRRSLPISCASPSRTAVMAIGASANCSSTKAGASASSASNASDGPEFVAKRVRSWLGRIGVRMRYIEPAGPWENGHCESVNSKLRDELLEGEQFSTLYERRRSSSDGDDIAKPSGRSPREAIVHQHPKRQCRQRLLWPTIRSGQPRRWPSQAGFKLDCWYRDQGQGRFLRTTQFFNDPLETQIAEFGVVVGAAALRPHELALAFLDRDDR